MLVCEHLKIEADKNVALTEAAREGHVICVQNQMENGADVNKAIEREYRSCYSCECKQENGHGLFIETLIQAGADVNKYEYSYHGSPLMCAVNTDNTKCVNMLINVGVDVNKAGDVGWTPLMAAASKGHDNALRGLIAAGAKIDAGNEYYGTPLLQAAGNFHLGCMSALIKAGADVNATGRHGATPLFKSVSWGDGDEQSVKCVSLLIKAGADVNYENYYGNTALKYAAENGLVGSMGLLIDAGADVNVPRNKEDYNDAPLSRAAKFGKPQCVALLIQRGTDVNFTYLHNVTPLISCLLAAQGEGYIDELCNKSSRSIGDGNTECIKLLINAGADVYAIHDYGCTTLSLAVESECSAAVEVLMKEGNTNVNKRYENGATMLMYAVGNGQMKLLDFLLDKGADINASNNSGSTALMWAARQGYDECVQKLIVTGADVNKARNRGATALVETTFASANERRKYLMCAQLLLRAGANVNETSASAITNSNYKFQKASANMKLLLYAAGLPINVPFEEQGLCLKNVCREAIRCHLMSLNPANLFNKVEQLKSTPPSLLCSFLLYDMLLDMGFEIPLANPIRRGYNPNYELY